MGTKNSPTTETLKSLISLIDTPLYHAEGTVPSVTMATVTDKEPPSQLELRPSLATIYPAFIALNGIVFLFAIPINSFLLIKTLTTFQTRNSRVLQFLVNAALCDLFKLIFVMPITLANLLLQNFVFGSFLCYALPMLQVFPIHVSIFNYAGLTYDRYQGIRYPDKRSVPVMVITISSWILALCSVLPYTGFITYIDLEQLRGPQYQNLGLCFIHVQKTIEDYLRATFFCIFIIPLLVIVYLLTRTSWELSFQQKTAETCVCDAECGLLPHLPSQTLLRLKHGRVQHKPDVGNGLLPEGYRGDSFTYSRSTEPSHTRKNRLDSEAFDTQSILGVECAYCISELQRRDQRRIAIIIGLFIAAWTPINIFILTTHFFPDSKAVSLEVQDIVNLSLTWLGFVSTCWNPFIIYPMLVERAHMYDVCKPKSQEPVRKSSTSSRKSKHRPTGVSRDCSSRNLNETATLINGGPSFYNRMQLSDSIDSLRVNV